MGLYDETIGTFLIGIFFNTYLYGLVTYQFVLYCRTKFNDRLALKCMVHFLFALDTFHSASVMYMAYYYTVTNFGNPVVLTVASWPYNFTPVSIALTALITHGYLATRIWRLTNSKVLFGVAIMLATVSFVLGFTLAVKAWISQTLAEIELLIPLVITWLSVQVAVDTFITATLVIVFSRSRTGFRRTDTLLNRFIRGAIQTGLFSSLFSMADLISLALLPHTYLHSMFAIPIGRIYTNTLLDTLLTRELLMERDAAGNVTRSIVVDSMYWVSSDPQAISSVQTASIPVKA